MRLVVAVYVILVTANSLSYECTNTLSTAPTPTCVHNTLNIKQCVTHGHPFNKLHHNSKYRADTICKLLQNNNFITSLKEGAPDMGTTVDKYKTSAEYSGKLARDIKELTKNYILNKVLTFHSKTSSESEEDLRKVKRSLVELEQGMFADSLSCLPPQLSSSSLVVARSTPLSPPDTPTYNTPIVTRYTPFTSSYSIHTTSFNRKPGAAMHKQCHMEGVFNIRNWSAQDNWIIDIDLMVLLDLDLQQGLGGWFQSVGLSVRVTTCDDTTVEGVYTDLTTGVTDNGRKWMRYTGYIDWGMPDIFLPAFQADPAIEKNLFYVVGEFGSAVEIAECVNYEQDKLSPGFYSILSNGTCVGGGMYGHIPLSVTCNKGMWGAVPVQRLSLYLIDAKEAQECQNRLADNPLIKAGGGSSHISLEHMPK